MSDDNQRAVIQAFVFPLVSWIWIGYWTLLAGTLICLVPGKQRLQYARTQVIGVAEKHVPVA
jgi:cytochrome c-type biogenesis protein CcmF